ncbi:MAG TPA: ribonuclease HIII [Candidatus Binatia bacterium]|nr:ribonuclease HIII [Candidatus Binatia bacterium]
MTTPPAGGAIGTDESGKGDYFGPLVVAGVWVGDGGRDALAALGVRDSKTVSDAQAHRLAAAVRTAHPTSVVAIGPERYNELYASMGNLNRLLAWGHARVIENLLEAVPECRHAISDQFGDARVLERALLERGRQIVLTQHPRAEADPVVAAASIVARAEFLSRLEKLSTRFGLPLAKGAGPPVLTAGQAFVRRHGAAALGQVAKLHFRTTKQVTGAA